MVFAWESVKANQHNNSFFKIPVEKIHCGNASYIKRKVENVENLYLLGRPER